MATHSTGAKQDTTNAAVDRLDNGAGANPVLRLKDGATTIVDLPMSNPAFGDADANGVATANAFTATDAAEAGTIDAYEYRDKDGNVEISGSDIGLKLPIVGVDTGAETVEVSGDQTAEFTAGRAVRITGSTGNDGDYTVASSSYSAGSNRTTITFDEDVSDATADGEVLSGEVSLENKTVNAGQEISVASATYQALTQ